jgi:hypothetical protein
VCRNYLYFHHYEKLQEILKPYLTARFTPEWQAVIQMEFWIGIGERASGLDYLIETLCSELDKLSEPLEKTKLEAYSFEIRIDSRFVVKKPAIGAVKAFI